MRLSLYSARKANGEVKLSLAGVYSGELVEVVMSPAEAAGLSACLKQAVADLEGEAEGLGYGYFVRARGFSAPTVADLTCQLNSYLASRGAQWVREVRFLVQAGEYAAFVVEEVEAEGD
ncbi:MAG: hypothetical protein QME70_09650 [Bacillota bacterium]|nr:hypothetical protein [Bacillota bacterium]